LIGGNLDPPAFYRARDASRRGEEFGRREIVAAVAAVDEVEDDRAAGGEADRRGREIEAGQLDLDPLRHALGERGCGKKSGEDQGTHGDDSINPPAKAFYHK